MPETNQDNFKHLVALFLAEILRSRRASLKRAAEISMAVVEALPNLQSEEQVLNFLTEVERDFEEVGTLKQALYFNYEDSDVEVYEREIKEYASLLFETDMVNSATFLQDAVRPDMNIQKLCIRYPGFCQHLLLSTEKMPLLKRLDLAL